MFYFKILCEIFKNLFYLFKLNKILNFNSNPDMSNDLNTDYIQRFYKHYQFINLFKSNLPNNKQSFFEIGPGGSLSNFYTAKHLGFNEYYAYDGIKHNVFGPYSKNLYQLIKKKFNFKVEPTKDLYFYKSLENLNNLKFNFIYSWGVLEHVDDLDKLFKFLKDTSEKNALHLHVVDTHPHGWSNFKDPYSIFKISKFIWKLMYSERYFINRFRESFYKNLLKKYNFEEIKFNVDEVNNFIKLNYKNETLINEIDDKSLLSKKSSFLNEFKKLGDEDILKRRFILLFKKI